MDALRWWRRRLWMPAAAAWCSSLAVVDWRAGEMFGMWLMIAFALLYVPLIVMTDLRRRDEHRRARGDRHGAAAGTAAGAGTVYVAAANYAGGTTKSPGASLMTHTADVPFLGYKRARLMWSGSQFQLVAFNDTVHRRDNLAQCLPAGSLPVRTSLHAAPYETCLCGFHACRDRAELAMRCAAGNVEMLVELSGKVIVHEHGYRAQHQRILSLRAGDCDSCGAPDASYAALASSYSVSGVSLVCGRHNAVFAPAVRAGDLRVVPLTEVAESLGLGLPIEVAEQDRRTG